VCGNKQCEHGETCATSNGTVIVASAGCCSADCPASLKTCPTSSGGQCSGHGDCLSRSGTCSCHRGYAGSQCQTCSKSFVSVRSSSSALGYLCVYLPGALSSCSDGVQNSLETGVDCGGSCPPCVDASQGSSSSTNTASTSLLSQTYVQIALVVAMVGLLVLTVVCVAVMVRRRRRKRQQSVLALGAKADAVALGMPKKVGVRSINSDRDADKLARSRGSRKHSIPGDARSRVTPSPSLASSDVSISTTLARSRQQQQQQQQQPQYDDDHRDGQDYACSTSGKDASRVRPAFSASSATPALSTPRKQDRGKDGGAGKPSTPVSSKRGAGVFSGQGSSPRVQVVQVQPRASPAPVLDWGSLQNDRHSRHKSSAPLL
jgi:hypothetical protein